MVSKSCEVRLKLERHYAEDLDCLRSPVHTRSTSSALCLFPFLWWDHQLLFLLSLPQRNDAAVLCLSLHQLSELSHCACWAAVPSAAGSSWETWGSKVFCSYSLCSDKPLITVFIWYLLGSFPVLLHLLPSEQPIMGTCQNFSFCSQIQISTTLLK